jgi:hypothetical protein
MSKEIYGVCLAISKQNNNRFLLCDDNHKVTEVAINPDWGVEVEVGTHYCAIGEEVEEQGKTILNADYFDQWGRYCSHCGKHHTEGYYSENTGLYACSDECLSKLYTEQEIEEEREHEWLFWTEWE